MKRLNRAILCATIIVLLSGCSGYFDTIEKNKVMVKKLNEEQTKGEASYGDLLSLETVNTLSINAVNKYFDKKLKEDDVQIDIRVVDQENLRHLLENLEDAAPRPEGSKSILFDTETNLKEVPSGLFYVDLGDKTDSTIQYDLVLNARDGKVLQVKEQIAPKVIVSPKSRVINPIIEIDNSDSNRLDKVIEIATRFIKEKDGSTSVNLALGEKSMRWEGTVVELFIKDEHDESSLYSVFVDINTNTVVGFNRDLMVMLSFFS
ncbi:hypothetical protein FHS15_000169 [Paenibacillus castaneae]|uniref:hypothetical protein n=1 Tax=Paenibacillus castaneae TaxID=474957 RepID=UPI000C9B0377|nr:hypothetical protein [Paenibacillus castaneae]NIK75071.1 hypothetical protein [Paenibacillus castaneae]